MVFYDNKPSVIEAVGNGSFLYRYNIEEVEAPASQTDEQTEGETRTQWQCEEVTVWGPLTSNRITEAVIRGKWPNDYEQKLINEYNGANLGLYGAKTSPEAKAKIAKYTDFLTERVALKAQIDEDCAEHGID